MTEEMEAGRELDALVAEKVMGWVWWAKHGRRILANPEATNFGGGEKDGWYKATGNEEPAPELGAFLPQYSTDIWAAWQVVEKLVAEHAKVAVSSRIGKWGCSIITHAGTSDEGNYFEYGETAPEAICRAALKMSAQPQRRARND